MRVWEEILLRIRNLGSQSFSSTHTGGVNEVTRGDQGKGFSPGVDGPHAQKALEQTASGGSSPRSNVTVISALLGYLL